MGDEQYEGYERISRVLDYFTPTELVKWKVKVGSREAKRIGTVAMNIGTNVDEWIKATVMGVKPPKLKTEEARNCVEGYKRWVDEYGLVLEVGKRVFDEGLKVTGEPDLLGLNTVIDIKCSSEIRPSYWLQTEFYAKNTRKVNKAILRLDKYLGVYEYQVRPVNPKDWFAVVGLVEAYRFYQSEQSLTEGKEERVNDNESSITDGSAGSKEGVEEPEIPDDRTGRDW